MSGKSKPLVKQPCETVKIGCCVCKSLILRKNYQKPFRGHGIRGHLCQKIKNETGDKDESTNLTVRHFSVPPQTQLTRRSYGHFVHNIDRAIIYNTFPLQKIFYPFPRFPERKIFFAALQQQITRFLQIISTLQLTFAIQLVIH
ncbi:MAG: hypothetical protein CMB97_01505 [Flavobacteriaceae bacterium]|nr:hypothetical protein [Flavobacteriaceae bacterium]